MSMLTLDGKMKRTLKFLMASGEPEIAQMLLMRGFRDEDRNEGWALLDAAAGRQMSAPSLSQTPPTRYNMVLGELDSWENIWFDVADAALGRLFPAAHEMLFQNLSKSSGSEVLLTVKTFTGRIRGMEEDEEDALMRKAAAEPARRGLNNACLTVAEDLIRSLASEQTPPTPPVDPAANKAEREAAVAAMWDWFLDWSKTARTVIKNRNHHVMLGLISRRGGAAATDDDDNDIKTEEDETFMIDEPNKDGVSNSVSGR